MNPKDYDYELPKHLIAQAPLSDRSSSRLLVADRRTSTLQDRHFSDILDLIPSGDVLVLNDTKVFPARLLGRKKHTGGKVDVLLLEPGARAQSADPQAAASVVWRCLVQPVLREDQEVEFPGTPATARFAGRSADGIVLMEFFGIEDLESFAKAKGTIPLPPYIKREPAFSDEETYQTVYAKKEGAVAAPTAGLHFTTDLLKKLSDKGVEIHTVTLHVGYGTFKPVEDPERHRMHSERFELSQQTASVINKARLEKRKIWAVGTTTLRVLETCVMNGEVLPGAGETDLFIRSPFTFETVDHLITNFHLPKTTLLLLVSAFMGESLRKTAYEHAIRSNYRFYSYGDAMVII